MGDPQAPRPEAWADQGPIHPGAVCPALTADHCWLEWVRRQHSRPPRRDRTSKALTVAVFFGLKAVATLPQLSVTRLNSYMGDEAPF
jgi:hypothetical protein